MKNVSEIARKKSMDIHLSCVLGNNSDDCVTKIKNNDADLKTLDGGRVYSAGKMSQKYNLVPRVSPLPSPLQGMGGEETLETRLL